MTPDETNVKQKETVLQVQDYLRVLRSRWKEVLLVFLLVFVSCAVVTKTMTPMYRSVMRFEILLPRDIINVAQGDVNPVQQTVHDYYLQTQFQALVSENNLKAVVNKLGLAAEWETDETMAAVRVMRSMEVIPVPDTNLVDVWVKDSDPKLAQRICEEIAECYREVRKDGEDALINEAINKRYEVLRERQDELERKADVVRQYIRSGKYISYMWQLPGQGTPASSTSEEQVFQMLTNNRLALQTEISQMTVHINKLQELQDVDLLGYVTRTGLLTAESYSSARVRELYEQHQKEEAERAQMLLSGYGQRHPVVLRMDEQHKTSRARLDEELIGMRDSMVDQLAVKKSELESLEGRLLEARNNLRDKTLEDQKVLNALQEYNAEKARYDKLESDYEADKMRMTTPRLYTKIYQQATLPLAPSSPNVALNLIIGAAVGLVIGVLVAFAYDYFDTSVKTLEDAERHLGLPVLGVIPQDAGLLMLQGSNGPDAEAYRILRTNIELKRSLFKATTFAVVSSSAGEGKTTTLINLAYVFAQAGYSTLMIDADLRRPMLARYAEVNGDVGLLNYLTGEAQLKDVVFRTDVPNLYLVPSGPLPSDPSGVLGSYRMGNLLSEASKRFDIIFIDSPPILGISDSSLLVSKADATLLVLQPRRMQLKALQRAKDVIRSAGGNPMGLVMNNVDISGDTQYQYYTSYYAYYSQGSSKVDVSEHTAHADDADEQEPTADEAPETSSTRKEREPKTMAVRKPGAAAAEEDDDLY